MAKLLPIYPSPTDVQAILAACTSARDRMLVELCWATGARISEVIVARVGDLTASGLRMVNLKQHGSAQKHVFLPAAFLARLRAFCGDRDQTEPIIARTDGHPINRRHAWRIITTAGRRAGVFKQRYGDPELRPPWPHSFRHGNAIHLLENGVPVNAVSAQLGHANLQSTAVYLALSDPHRQALIDRVSF